MLELALLVAVLGLGVTFVDWRTGLLVTVAAGFGQDVIRKFVPGEPVYLTAAVVLFFGVAFAGALARGMPLSLGPIYRVHRALRAPLSVFMAIVVLQVIAGFARTGSLMLAGIGTLSYFAPVVALMLAFRYALNAKWVRRLLIAYVIGAAAMCAGIYLQVAGVDWPIIGSVGEGVFIYPSSGGRLELPSGFFRSAENAAWHGATACCVLIALVVSQSWNRGRWAAVALGVFLVGAVILTGRRKAIMDIVIFLFIYGGLLMYFRRSATKLAVFLGAAAVIAVTAQAVLLPEDDQVTFKPYVERSATVAEDALDRLTVMTVGALQWSLQRNGFFGAGAGLGGQGAQHFGGGASLVGGGAESGLGKFLGELGVPGLAAFLWVGYVIAVCTWRTLRSTKSKGPEQALLDGLVAIMAANGMVFVTAAQIFGDPFVLLVLGMLLGFVLASPVRAMLKQGRIGAQYRLHPAGLAQGRHG